MSELLIRELRMLMDEAGASIAKPGDVHTRADGDYEKQHDGTWKKLPAAHGRPVTRVATKAKTSAQPSAEPTRASAPARAGERARGGRDSFARVIGTTSESARDARHPATVRGVGWVPGAGPWVDKAKGLPESTWKDNFDTDPNSPGYNTPTNPERKKLHDEIFSAFLDNTPRVPDDQQPVAIVTMGLPASGKSTAIQALSIDSSKFVPADADLVKNYIPEFQEGLNQRAKNSADVVHDESAYLVEQMRERAMKQRKCLIADGTGSNLEIWSQLLKDLKKNGYRVHLLMADLPADECKRRIADRAEKTGRYVPPGRVDALAPKIQANFMKLKDLSDTSMLFSTESGDPVPLYTRVDHEPEEVYDDDAYAGFKKKAGVSEAVRATLMVRATLREAATPKLQPKRSLEPFVSDEDVAASLTLGTDAENKIYAMLPKRFPRGEGVDMMPELAKVI